MKNHDFTTKKIIFFPILGGGARRVRPSLDPPLQTVSVREQRGIDTEQLEDCFISREKLYIECVDKTYIKSKMKRN